MGMLAAFHGRAIRDRGFLGVRPFQKKQLTI